MSNSDKKQAEKARPFKMILSIALIAFPIIWLMNWILVKWYYSCSPESQGLFGDMFGASTSLFAGISVVLLIYTVLLQKEEIAEGREEFKKQNRTLSYQRFDNTFFNMLELHHRILANLPWKHESFAKYISDHINRLEAHETLERLRESYNSISLSFTLQHFGKYIGNFEIIIDYVLTQKKKSKNQDKYLKIYFAQLTTPEKVFLLYYYNLTEKPVFWNRCKTLLFGSLYSNHLHHPPHANVLDGINDILDRIK